MPANELFGDSDPEGDEIFERVRKVQPKSINVTENQKVDPMRKVKIELQAVLVAEKIPISTEEIRRRLLDSYGACPDPKRYNCSTLDDLLQACSESIVHTFGRDGIHRYGPRTTEANQDIIEMVQQQSSSKRPARSFLGSGATNNLSTHGSSFRAFRGPYASEEIAKSRGTPEQFKARHKLGPAKTISRVKNLAEVLKEYADEIGVSHPDEPNRKIVTLAALANKFKQLYCLPAWGKNISESELYIQLNVPPFNEYLHFWRLSEKGDIFVDCIDRDNADPTQKSEQNPSADVSIQSESFGGSASAFEQSVVSAPSTIRDQTSDSFDGFNSFEVPPENGSKDSKIFNSNQESIDDYPGNAISRDRTADMTDIALRFGTVSVASQQCPVSSSLVPQNGILRQSRAQEDDNNTSILTIQSSRRNHSVLRHRTIKPRNPTQNLAEVVKTHGSIPYEALSDCDKIIVDLGKNIFKVYATQPGEMMVRLCDPHVDTTTLPLLENNLRDPVESDLRWMTLGNSHIKKQSVKVVKPAMFIAPRGFLLILKDEEREEMDVEKVATMGNILRAVMVAPIVELQRETVRTGSAAVYVYRQGAEVRYYRVLIVGQAKQDGEVLVLLADVDDQYFVDVHLSHLFPIPEEASFKHFPSNVVFATLHGVLGLTLSEQDVMFENIDNDDTKRFVGGYFHGNDDRILNIDMVWKNERGQFEWLSQIVKRRGAVTSSDANIIHFPHSALDVIKSVGPDCSVCFVDYSVRDESATSSLMESTRIVHDSRESMTTTYVGEMPSPIIEEIDATSSFDPKLLNLHSLFDKLIEEQNVTMIVGMFQFVRSLKDLFGDNNEWERLLTYMLTTGKNNNIRL